MLIALTWTAGNGHERAVRTLLERDDANPDTGDKYRRTPLYFAAEKGHEGVMRILLGRDDVNLNTTDTTPIANHSSRLLLGMGTRGS